VITAKSQCSQGRTGSEIARWIKAKLFRAWMLGEKCEICGEAGKLENHLKKKKRRRKRRKKWPNNILIGHHINGRHPEAGDDKWRWIDCQLRCVLCERLKHAQFPHGNSDVSDAIQKRHNQHIAFVLLLIAANLNRLWRKTG
jgi:hypothetical protein